MSNEQSAPAGYVMVPVEPNEAMLDAMWNNVQQEPEDSQLKVLYKAMLASAPKAEQPPVQGPIGETCMGHSAGVIFYTWLPYPKDGTKLYAAPKPVSDDARDAARYRWLRKHNGDMTYKDVLCFVELPRGPSGPELEAVTGKRLDAAIDAAMGSNGDE